MLPKVDAPKVRSAKTIAVRLTDGQDLIIEIKKLLDEHQIEAGVVLSAVGGLKKSRIRVPITSDKVTYIPLHDQTLEIVSLQGTVSKNGCHLHICVSDTVGKVWGGHLGEGCIIWMTCELVIGVLEHTTFTREMDTTTGYNELTIRNK